MVTLRADGALRFRARAGDYLYDCHGRGFAPTDHGENFAWKFSPLYLGLMFGIQPNDWARFARSAVSRLKHMTPENRGKFVTRYSPKLDVTSAVGIAIEALPAAARFIELTGRAVDPVTLRDEYLFQPNVPLAHFEARMANGEWTGLVANADGLKVDQYTAIREVLGRATTGKYDLNALARDGAEREVVRSLEAAQLFEPTPPPLESPPPGMYLCGHSSLLVRGATNGVLIDPQLTSPVGRRREGCYAAAELAPLVDHVALTHGHYDHYHLPTLLQLGDRPMFVPRVGRASLVCEDIAARLTSIGIADVRELAWGSEVAAGDVRLAVLPFIGEQFLTSELYPDARNWGNCFVAEHNGVRGLIVVDAGFESDRSIIDVVAQWTAKHGPIDFVATQAIALRTVFGEGDEDLQITALACASRAHHAVELLRPEHRVTLAPEDLPALCRAAMAKKLVLYGMFAFTRGAPATDDRRIERTRAALIAANSTVELQPLRIGEGIGFRRDLPVVRL